METLYSSLFPFRAMAKVSDRAKIKKLKLHSLWSYVQVWFILLLNKYKDNCEYEANTILLNMLG